MKHPLIARSVLTVFFVGLLTVPAIIRRVSSQEVAQLDKKAALARHGFYLQEVAHQSGIDFVHQAPTLDPQLAGIMPQVASMAPRFLSSILTAMAGRISM